MTIKIEPRLFNGELSFVVYGFDEAGNIILYRKFFTFEDAELFVLQLIYQKSPE